MKDTTTTEPDNAKPTPPVNSTPPPSPKADNIPTTQTTPNNIPIDLDADDLLEGEGEDEFPIETTTVVSPEEIPEEWIYPLRLTLEELFTGINLRFRITRHLLSGKKKSEAIRAFHSRRTLFCSMLTTIFDHLGIDVQPGWRAVSLQPNLCFNCPWF